MDRGEERGVIKQATYLHEVGGGGDGGEGGYGGGASWRQGGRWDEGVGEHRPLGCCHHLWANVDAGAQRGAEVETCGVLIAKRTLLSVFVQTILNGFLNLILRHF